MLRSLLFVAISVLTLFADWPKFAFTQFWALSRNSLCPETRNTSPATYKDQPSPVMIKAREKPCWLNDQTGNIATSSPFFVPASSQIAAHQKINIHACDMKSRVFKFFIHSKAPFITEPVVILSFRAHYWVFMSLERLLLFRIPQRVLRV